MTYIIAAYFFLSVSSGIAMTKSSWWGDLIASQITGLLWPIIFTAQLIRKVDSLLK